jgi:glycosyltransferase involved in cell wall biosynthesis
MKVPRPIKFERKNFLVISPEPWTHVFVSKHHYAIELAKRGNSVFFLNPPSSEGKASITPSQYDNVFVVDYSVNVRGQRFLPGFLRRSIDRKVYNSIQQEAGVKFNVIWNFENSRFYDLRFAPRDVTKIYHQVDLNQNFHPQLAARTADICFCTTDLILSDLKRENARSYKIHHGVSQNAFIEKPRSTEDVVENAKTITALYVGSLDMPYIDLDVAENIVKMFPSVDFFFVGPYQEEGDFFQRMQQHSNCFFKGRVKSEELKDYTIQSDILLVFYKERYHKDQANPHKLMEYLASGKVVVATYTGEYEDTDGLLIMSRKNEDLPRLFQYAIDHLQELNSCEQRQKRVNYAREHTYDKQLDKIENFIDQLLG